MPHGSCLITICSAVFQGLVPQLQISQDIGTTSAYLVATYHSERRQDGAIRIKVAQQGHHQKEIDLMLWTITIILIILWILGLVTSYTLGGWIHILLVLAIIILIFNLLSGRRGI